MRIDDPVLKFEKLDDDSQWRSVYYNLWIGAWRSFDCSVNVHSNYDQNQFATFTSDSGPFKLKGYSYREDDKT